MPLNVDEILQALDQRAESFEFPMLDNGYVYLAAIRLSLFRSPVDWALVFERFGYSPRAYLPSLDIQTFSSGRSDAGFTSVTPIEDGDWIDSDETEFVADDAVEIAIRGSVRSLPRREEYLAFGIELTDPDRVHIFELCRYLAATARNDLLATDHERRVDLAPNLSPLLVLDEWHHPDLVNDELPSQCETFQQLAGVLATGDCARYRPTRAPNTHWKNWPDGGSL